MIYSSVTRQGIKLDVPYDWQVKRTIQKTPLTILEQECLQVEPELLNLMMRCTAYKESYQQVANVDEGDTAVELERVNENEIIAASLL